MISTYPLSFLFLFLLLKAGAPAAHTDLRTYEAEIPASVGQWVALHRPGTDLHSGHFDIAVSDDIPPPASESAGTSVFVADSNEALRRSKEERFNFRKFLKERKGDTNEQNPKNDAFRNTESQELDAADEPADEPAKTTDVDTPPATQNNTEVDDLRMQNDELKARLDRLEKLLEGKAAATTDEPAAEDTEAVEQKPDPQPVGKTLPGWLVELYPWRADGRLADDAEATAVFQNCEFDGTLGANNRNDMKIYRFQGNFHAKEPGRYAFGMDLTCGRDHTCVMGLTVDDEELINFSGNAVGERLMGGIALEAGNHRVTFHTYLPKNKFIKYSPATRFRWHPLIKAPGDMNFRDFEREELFVQIPRNQRIGSKKC